jgi:cob(I)alamin adenosyltransferase
MSQTEDGGSRSDKGHAQRMARKKAAVDEAIARAGTERGVLVVLTGPGKGKSSSAFGMAARALGHGVRVAVIQFVKSREDTGEAQFFRRQQGVEWSVCGEGFTWETRDRSRDAEAARRAWAAARKALSDPEAGLVILDEITFLFTSGHLDLAEALEAIANRPPMQHVVVTGRGAPPALAAAADTVSEIKDVKHAFRAGVRAQRGIDF